MKTGRYSLKELLTHNEIEQIIIPEIQRDYVWEIDNVAKLIDDINKNYEKKKSHKLELKINGIIEENDTVNQFLTKEYERLKYHQKLGFIYAYHDRDYAGKFFLIDGQQRLTTLFLILLFLYKEVGKGDAFSLLYFKDDIPKVNYKVREESNDFLQLLIQSVLKGENYENSEKFYKSDYLKDVTICHLIENFKHIEKQVGNIKNKLEFLEYLEDFVEVNYFDTHLSEQGEQLYIYMNSRGEQLSFQEIVRAELMQKINDPKKKIELGNEWEKWQNFFWQNRGENENADKGFEEFLKWAAIIHLGLNNGVVLSNIVDSEKQLTRKQLKENYIKVYSDANIKKNQSEALFKYQIKYLDFEFLTNLFDALSFIYKERTKYIPVLDEWLNNKIKIIDYVILLPLIQYVAQNDWLDDYQKIVDIERLGMFLKNTTYFEGVSKNPDTSTLDAILIVSQLIEDKNNIDNIQNINDFSATIITEAELYKVEHYLNSNSERREWEEFIWDITLDESFNTSLMGDISVLFKCLESEITTSEEIVELEVISQYLEVLRKVIFKNKQSTRLRRLILSKFDYLIPCGSGLNGSLDKFSFISNPDNWETRKEWRTTFENELFVDLMKWMKNSKEFDLKILLDNAVLTFPFSSWQSAFIKYPSLLRYCQDKKILWQDENRILLLEKTNYSIANSKEIQCALLESKFKERGMWMHENNCCVLQFEFKNDEIEFEKQNSKTFTLDLVYHPKDFNWTFSFFHKERHISEIVDVEQVNNWIKIVDPSPKWVEKDRLSKINNVLYVYDQSLSLIKNNIIVADKLNELILEIKSLLR